MKDKYNSFVFIDESGDTGFKMNEGSSQSFCLAAIIFYDQDDIDITERVILDLKPTLGLRKTHEFHFTNEPDRIRSAFCHAIAGKPFLIRAIIADKDKIETGTKLRKSPAYFYAFFIEMLLRHHFGAISNARVFIDGNMDRELKTYLRQELNQGDRLIAQCKFKDSKSSPIIQLADMVAGSIARSYYPDKGENKKYRRILQPNIDDIWEFGAIIGGKQKS